ncbi:hypothetical protein POM88_017160 [Heracleum sosnowskyi]|uniref:Uncharacterized protein n=1 Tax=Heracleum sosnowskyi TaxID=360622 RepID=A0AAD8MY32_9APIA|nr:hypothetical protein POM88_017160 [Heracleum sosnowskyi]
MIDSGAVAALIRALSFDGVVEEAAGALALIVRQPIGAEAFGKEETAVAGLISLMRSGSPKWKENHYLQSYVTLLPSQKILQGISSSPLLTRFFDLFHYFQLIFVIFCSSSLLSCNCIRFDYGEDWRNCIMSIHSPGENN